MAGRAKSGLAPNFLQNVHGLSIREIGALGSVGSLGTVALSLGLGSLHAGVGFLLGQVAMGLFAALLWQGNTMIWFGAAYFFLGGFRAARSLAMAVIGEFVPPENIGLTYGIAETVAGMAVIFAPPLAGFLYETNPVSIFQTALGLILLSALWSAARIYRSTSGK